MPGHLLAMCGLDAPVMWLGLCGTGCLVSLLLRSVWLAGARDAEAIASCVRYGCVGKVIRSVRHGMNAGMNARYVSGMNARGVSRGK